MTFYSFKTKNMQKNVQRQKKSITELAVKIKCKYLTESKPSKHVYISANEQMMSPINISY